MGDVLRVQQPGRRVAAVGVAPGRGVRLRVRVRVRVGVRVRDRDIG